jgi:membrane-associated phospholipid phosphatase
LKTRLRASEWIITGFFAYVALIGLFFPDRPHLRGGFTPTLEFLIIFAVVKLIASFEGGSQAVVVSHIRDWLPLAYTLLAFREMELFLPHSFPGRLEAGWIQLDRLLLDRYHLRAAIETFGSSIPLYLEFCYLLVYGVSAACVGILYGRGRRSRVDSFWVTYLVGTLLAYALFPFFPSQPPRIVFPGFDNPSVTTWARQFNLFILRRATIHVGVFPSAHVSSAFACAWAMFALIPERKLIGWLLLLYAISVSIATVYGRYHYAADVVAGFTVSIVAAAAAQALARKK